MEWNGNTVLVTGGASGIGLAFVKRFAKRGNKVIICGRREDKLAAAASEVPGVITRVCDAGDPSERNALVEWLLDDYPDLNVLVNNAGIQRRNDLRQSEDWERTRSEIAINLDAPIHFSRLLIPHFLAKKNAAIVNITSGLSFVPLAGVPVYCATKAALRSFTQSLRWQLSDTPIEVVEVVPPAVDTDLQAPGLHKFGVNVDEFADAVFEGLEHGKNEIAYGTALSASQASREVLDTIFQQMNQSFSWKA